MNEQNFCKRVSFLAPGDGFRKCLDVKLSDLRVAADGTILTGSTNPSRTAIETSFVGVVAAANQTTLGAFDFVLPEDFDESSGELILRLLCNSAGTTNAPKITATGYAKREGVALSSAVSAQSAAIPKTSATTGADWVVITGAADKAAALKPGDALWVVLTTEAHATDAINVYALELWYRSNLAFTNIDDR